MKIIYLMRQELHIYPPCLSQILYLNEFGVEVLVVYGGCDENVRAMLSEKGIPCVDLNIERKRSGIVDKMFSIFEYRRKARSTLKQNFNKGDLVWFGTADSAFLLQGKMLNHKKYVMTVLELYDTNRFYRHNIGRIIHKAQAVICCEKTRANIMKLWWNLKKKPYVLPNKPYEHPGQTNLIGTLDVTSQMINKFEDGIGIIYQGIFSKDRDVGRLAVALNELEQNIKLYLMGHDKNGNIEEIKKTYKNTVYLGFAPAPFHLEVTSHAQIGIALYDDTNMNNLFCAPNKIYEYAGFGIPILGSDVPGLRDTIEKYCAGVCVDFGDVEAIKKAIITIVNNYEKYSENAKKMFFSTNNKQTMKKILEDLLVIEREAKL